jgi:hypothetical protein
MLFMSARTRESGPVVHTINNKFLTTGVVGSQAESKGIAWVKAYTQEMDPLSKYRGDAYKKDRNIIIVRDIADPSDKKSKKGEWTEVLLITHLTQIK